MNTRLDEHKDDPREVRSSKNNSVREIKRDSSTEKRFTGGKSYSTSSHKTEIDKKKNDSNVEVGNGNRGSEPIIEIYSEKS